MILASKASGAHLSLVGKSKDSLVITPAATATAHLVITALVPTVPGESGITVAVADAGGDTLAVSVSGSAITISLANTTDSKNTLDLIAAAINSKVGVGQNTGTTTRTVNTAIVRADVYGTSTPGSAQLVHGGTNTLAATALDANAVDQYVFEVVPA
jgi:hypothetical protein